MHTNVVRYLANPKYHMNLWLVTNTRLRGHPSCGLFFSMLVSLHDDSIVSHSLKIIIATTPVTPILLWAENKGG